MKKILLILIFSIFSLNANAFEIFALGTSNTNCKGADQAYTTKLNELLADAKINATVINGGADGDRPMWMLKRLQSSLSGNTDIKLVIFEPGPNEPNKNFNLEASAEILTYLQQMNMPTIYVSHAWIQDESEAKEFAEKYGATYYGHWNKGVPTDHEYRQYDMAGGGGGHMTIKGCRLWAANMLPTIKHAIEENKIH